MQRLQQRPRRRSRGFTLIEIMVVLTVASIVVAISIRGFSEMSAGNKRTTCQTNLRQVYLGLRQYMSDEAGQPPPYNPSAGLGKKSIGLWALYTFPDPNNPDAPALPSPPNVPPPLPATDNTRPAGRYLRNLKTLHCPADLDVKSQEAYSDPAKTTLNFDYLTYQGANDNGTPENGNPANTADDPPTTTGNTYDPKGEAQLYLPSRSQNSGASLPLNKLWKRQLSHYAGATPVFEPLPPTSDTVVTWCPEHRGHRDFDNVLFFDGTVQYLPHLQTVSGQDANGGACSTETQPPAVDDCRSGWRRVPRTYK